MAEQKHEESIAEKTKSEPELKRKFQEFIAERTELRKQRLYEIAKKEKVIKCCSNHTLSIQAQVLYTKI